MKYIASLILLVVVVFSSYAFVQIEGRDQIHKRIIDLRAELNKNEETFLSPSPADFEAYAEFLKQTDTGLIRILPRETYDKPTEMTIRGGGAYYSFTRLKHEYGYGSDLELAMGNFSVGFAGADYGYLVDVGDVPVQSVTLDHSVAQYLASLITPTKIGDARAEQVKANRAAPAVVGHTYVLRSINYDTSDVLV